MIPAKLDRTSSPAERAVFELIREQAPEEWIVLHHPVLPEASGAPTAAVDFVVVAPGLGVVCLEVKSRLGTTAQDLVMPTAQARRAALAVREALAGHITDVPIEWLVVCPFVDVEVANAVETARLVGRSALSSGRLHHLVRDLLAQSSGLEAPLRFDSRMAEIAVRVLRSPASASAQELNHEQVAIVRRVAEALERDSPAQFIVVGRTGTGKTTLCTGLAALPRGKSVLCLTHSAILAAQLRSVLASEGHSDFIDAFSVRELVRPKSIRPHKRLYDFVVVDEAEMVLKTLGGTLDAIVSGGTSLGSWVLVGSDLDEILAAAGGAALNAVTLRLAGVVGEPLDRGIAPHVAPTVRDTSESEAPHVLAEVLDSLLAEGFAPEEIAVISVGSKRSGSLADRLVTAAKGGTVAGHWERRLSGVAEWQEGRILCTPVVSVKGLEFPAVIVTGASPTAELSEQALVAAGRASSRLILIREAPEHRSHMREAGSLSARALQSMLSAMSDGEFGPVLKRPVGLGRVDFMAFQPGYGVILFRHYSDTAFMSLEGAPTLKLVGLEGGSTRVIARFKQLTDACNEASHRLDARMPVQAVVLLTDVPVPFEGAVRFPGDVLVVDASRDVRRAGAALRDALPSSPVATREALADVRAKYDDLEKRATAGREKQRVSRAELMRDGLHGQGEAGPTEEHMARESEMSRRRLPAEVLIRLPNAEPDVRAWALDTLAVQEGLKRRGDPPATVRSILFYRDEHASLPDIAFPLQSSVTLLLGPNGAGKTSLLRAVQNALTYSHIDYAARSKTVVEYSDDLLISAAVRTTSSWQSVLDRQSGELLYERTHKSTVSQADEELARMLLVSDAVLGKSLGAEDTDLDAYEAAVAFGTYRIADLSQRSKRSRAAKALSNQFTAAVANHETVRLLGADRLRMEELVRICLDRLAWLGPRLNAQDIPEEVEQSYRSRIGLFVELTNKYLRSCDLEVGPDGVVLLSGGRAANPMTLPSGVQHVILMFYFILLHFPRRSLVLIDEPELSLHVGWQLALVGDLKIAAEHVHSRLLLATHAPGVVTDWWDHVHELA